MLRHAYETSTLSRQYQAAPFIAQRYGIFLFFHELFIGIIEYIMFSSFSSEFYRVLSLFPFVFKNRRILQ